MTLAAYLQKIADDSEQVSPIRVYKFKREHLYSLFADYGLNKGAEIGVAEGLNSEAMCKANPNIDLMCVDPWLPVKDDKRSVKIGSDLAKQRYKEAVERLEPYPCKLVRKISMDAVRDVAWGSLDFVYIDGSHDFDYVMTDIIEWSKRVKPGGIVAGHDAYRFRNAGVVDAVGVYTHIHKVYTWFLTDERTPSWFWIKQ